MNEINTIMQCVIFHIIALQLGISELWFVHVLYMCTYLNLTLINQDSIISETMDLPPVNQTPTQFSGKTYGFFGGLKTPQNPSQPEQNWGLWTDKKTELLQYTSTVKDGVHNISRKLWYTLVHWSAHLFQTALHHSGTLFVLRPEL